MAFLHFTFVVVIVLNGEFYEKILIKAFDLTFIKFISGRKCINIFKTTVFHSQKYWKQNVSEFGNGMVLPEYELCQFSFYWIL